MSRKFVIFSDKYMQYKLQNTSTPIGNICKTTKVYNGYYLSYSVVITGITIVA